MDLVDALSGNTQARSIVELSLSTSFRRDYTSLYKAIAAYQPEKAKKTLAQLAGPYLSPPVKAVLVINSSTLTSTKHCRS